MGWKFYRRPDVGLATLCKAEGKERARHCLKWNVDPEQRIGYCTSEIPCLPRGGSLEYNPSTHAKSGHAHGTVRL